MPGMHARAATDEVMMMRPPPWLIMPGSTARAQWKAPLTCTSRPGRLPQRFEGAPHAQELSPYVDGHGAVPVLDAEIADGRGRPGDPGVVDQHVQSAQLGQGMREPGVDPGFRGHVGTVRAQAGQRGAGRRQRLVRDVAHLHARAPFMEGAGDGQADAGRAGRNHDAATGEIVLMVHPDVSLLWRGRRLNA
ncbi:hypothetical protein NB2BOR_A23420 [Bordetella parapertussis]|nr:hypothetical protein NB2BOR_A23420 [Bordetella parapertussis]